MIHKHVSHNGYYALYLYFSSKVQMNNLVQISHLDNIVQHIDNMFPLIVQWKLLTSLPVSCRFRMRWNGRRRKTPHVASWINLNDKTPSINSEETQAPARMDSYRPKLSSETVF